MTRPGLVAGKRRASAPGFAAPDAALMEDFYAAALEVDLAPRRQLTTDSHELFAAALEMDLAPRRQVTDSVLHSSELRTQLECQIAELLRAHLPTTPTLGMSVGSDMASVDADLPPGLTPPGLSPTASPTLGPMASFASDGSRASIGERQKSGESASTRASGDPMRFDYAAGLPEAFAESPELPATMGSDCTTIMLRNVPPRMTQRQLLKEVNGFGFGGTFDFLYIPMDSRRRSNRGIAFLNFTTPATALEFAQAIQGRQLKHPSAQREVEVMPADVQGFERNVENHLEALAGSADLNKPIVLRKLPERLEKTPAAATPAKAAPAAAKAKASPKNASSRMGLSMPHAAKGFVPQPVQQSMFPPTLAGHGCVANFCVSCGLRRGDGFIFCPRCGERFPGAP